MLPVQITVKDIPNSIVLEDHIRNKVMKLNHIFQRINSCRVVLHVPQKHKHQGKLYSVHIDMTVPGKELAVNHRKSEDVYVAIRDAFAAMHRQLENYMRKRQGYVKHHESKNHGYVKKLMKEEDYGFIQGMDGNEYYFSLTNTGGLSFSELLLGDIVEFIAIPAQDGWQANRVTRIKNHVV